ncbi:tRNA (adenosine(37)-N6)-threonylcarbamoyltransferase complex ATPase subunit type 1 TsaE [Bacillus taeanensis]|uniref:tRNA threonylcarbamoyladenosine biosynthesis protein TsaE n=1 Tax=Bacillus taeanensis TaxID=273032 RepID=A0A366XTV0_9BACI|nr:tRNA (adenosine(37)-N6)-threonylcarbamoyltransferase complex ATPase subunit type 1 TsaE [Bacillus taeanensis]RBW67574.1 tRNA (adenosine(37)-N6)-threonylcarbamoyltransferase complex ATPase subunit type 1 TsaE [Bacillus taeanensis]
MKRFSFITNSYEETKELAQRLGRLLKAGDVLTLEGDLGAGKTTFTKGLAVGLGIKRVVSSPTFTIIKEYQGTLPLYHMDVYRLEDSDEDLGFDEYFLGNGVTVVEWAKFIQDMLPEEYMMIEIYHESESKRRIIFTPKGERYVSLCKELAEE